MKNGIFIFFMCCIPLLGSSQIGNIIGAPSASNWDIDTNTKKNIDEADTDKRIASLAQAITKNSRSQEQRAKAIFLWIAENIQYDNELHNSKSLQKKIYTSEEKVITHVLKRKKALCGGFAFLFQRLCQEVKIEAKVIHGFTQQYGLKNNSNRPNHTWNAVQINGTWHVLDITWAISQSMDGSPNMFWYKTPLQDFRRSHISADTK